MKRAAYFVVDYYFIARRVLVSSMSYLDQARHFIWAQTYYKCYQQATLEQAFGRVCATKNNFLISQPKLLLWVLKRTVSLRRSFEHPKHKLKLMGKNTLQYISMNVIYEYYSRRSF